MVELKNKPIQIYLRRGEDLNLEQLPPEQDPLLDLVKLFDFEISDLAEKRENTW